MKHKDTYLTKIAEKLIPISTSINYFSIKNESKSSTENMNFSFNYQILQASTIENPLTELHKTVGTFNTGQFPCSA